MELDDYESLPESSSVAVHMCAGAAAGVMEHCIMYPFDSVKTRMQRIQPCAEARYKSIWEAFTKMVKNEGALRPVRGMSAVVAGAGPAHALYFSCYEKSKDVLSKTFLGPNNPVAHCIAGGLATLLHDAVMNPTEVIKQRMQIYNSPYKRCTDCMMKTYKAEGMKAFYRSYTTQLTMNIPFQCVHFMMYEFMQQVTNPERDYNPMAHMLSGAAAGGFAAAITTPLDVCKTLLNTQEKINLNSKTYSTIRGMTHAVQTIYHCCGMRGYFRGMQARVIAQTPATAISWSVYEFFKYILFKKSAKDSQVSHFTSAPSASITVAASSST